MLTMLGAVAAFENDIRRERQRDGIEAAKVAGVYRGGKARIDPEAIRTLRADGMGPSEIAAKLKIGRASVYRLLAGGADKSGSTAAN
jgi:DNA invertase Pin-like site-specific DNA recombinase